MGINQIQSSYLAMLTFRGMFYNSHFYVYAFAALAIAIAAAIVVWLRRKTATLDVYFGALAFIWVLAIVSSILVPGVSYLVTWPMIGCTIALGWVLWKNSPRSEIALTIGALPGIIIITPALSVMYHFALAPMIGILVFMVSLLLGLLIPQIALFTRNYSWRLSGLVMLVFVAFLIVGSLTAGFSPDQPRPNAVAYLLDSDSGKATWFSAGFLQDEWTQQFFTTEPELIGVGDVFPIERSAGFPVMAGEASVVDLPAPEVTILADEISGDVRTMRLNVSSPRGAEVMLLDVQPYQAMLSATINGKRIEPTESERALWSLTYYAVPAAGFEITLELDPAQDITLQISDQTWNLTADVLEGLDHPYQQRTGDMMPMPNFDYGTVVVTVISLD